MKLLVIALLLTVVAAAQTAPPAAAALHTTPSGLAINISPAQAQEPGVQKALRLLDQMVTALGGQAWLRLQTLEQVGRSYPFSRGETAGVGALYWRFWKWPDKERVELTKQRDWIIIYNGDRADEITFRGTAPLEKDALQDYLRRRHYSLDTVLREWLRQPGVALFYEGHGVAERKPAEQVSILNAQNEALTLWIDDVNHLPLKKSFTWRDPKTRERTEEAEGYDNYRAVQAIMTPYTITRYKDGERLNQRFITSVSINPGLPDSLFDAQAAAPPAKK